MPDASPRFPIARRAPASLRAFRWYNFRLWSLAGLVSTTGTWMQLVAQNWMVLELTGSTKALGVSVMLQSIPSLGLSLWGGGLADRCSKRQMLMITQLSHAAAAALLTLLAATGALTIAGLYVMAVVVGTIRAVDAPAASVFGAELVGDDDLSNALALGSAISSAGRVVGMSLAGVVIATAGAPWVFAIDAASYVVVIGCMVRMRSSEMRVLARSEPDQVGSMVALRYIARDRRLLTVLGLAFVLGSFGRNFQVTMAAMANGPFDGGAGAYGMLSTVFAVGALAGALVAARMRHLGLAVLIGVGLLASVVQMASGGAPSLVWFAVAMAPIAAGAVVIDTAVQTIVQVGTVEHLRGRVVSIAGLIGTGAGAFGGPALGTMADGLGPRVALFVGGLVAAAACVAAATVTSRSATRSGRGLVIYLDMVQDALAFIRAQQRVQSQPDAHGAPLEAGHRGTEWVPQCPYSQRTSVTPNGSMARASASTRS